MSELHHRVKTIKNIVLLKEFLFLISFHLIFLFVLTCSLSWYIACIHATAFEYFHNFTTKCRNVLLDLIYIVLGDTLRFSLTLLYRNIASYQVSHYLLLNTAIIHHKKWRQHGRKMSYGKQPKLSIYTMELFTFRTKICTQAHIHMARSDVDCANRCEHKYDMPNGLLTHLILKFTFICLFCFLLHENKIEK